MWGWWGSFIEELAAAMAAGVVVAWWACEPDHAMPHRSRTGRWPGRRARTCQRRVQRPHAHARAHLRCGARRNSWGGCVAGVQAWAACRADPRQPGPTPAPTPHHTTGLIDSSGHGSMPLHNHQHVSYPPPCHRCMLYRVSGYWLFVSAQQGPIRSVKLS